MTEDERTKVMIVDDHSVVRIGLKQVLEQSGEFKVVGQASSGEAAVSMAADVSPEVVVMDVIMPGKDGVEACREIMESAPETHVVMLTASTEQDAVVEAVAAGATGYLQKETSRERLLATVRAVSLGELRLPIDVVRSVFAEIRETAGTGDAAAAAGLTQREREILVSFAQGMSYAQIAKQREVKTVTIRNAIYAIQDKLDVGSMQGLVLWAVRSGLLDNFPADTTNSNPRAPMSSRHYVRKSNT